MEPTLLLNILKALHVIDVNSGKKVDSNKNQEANALSVNMIAAEEVRQLRLRDMGGIIVIDFIDLHKIQNRKMVYDKMVEVMKEDKAKTSYFTTNQVWFNANH